MSTSEVSAVGELNTSYGRPENELRLRSSIKLCNRIGHAIAAHPGGASTGSV